MTTVEKFICKGCGHAHRREAFGSNLSRADGRNPRCRVCERDRKRADRSTPLGRLKNSEATRRSKAKRASVTLAHT